MRGILAAFFGFFKKHIFKSRETFSGLNLPKFLEKYGPVVNKKVEELYERNKSKPLADWKDIAFQEVRREILALTPDAFDTWVDIAIGFAYETIKQRLREQDQAN